MEQIGIKRPLDHKYGWFANTVNDIIREEGLNGVEFWKWMNGQTCCCDENGVGVIFSHDVIHYVESKGKGQPYD